MRLRDIRGPERLGLVDQAPAPLRVRCARIRRRASFRACASSVPASFAGAVVAAARWSSAPPEARSMALTHFCSASAFLPSSSWLLARLLPGGSLSFRFALPGRDPQGLGEWRRGVRRCAGVGARRRPGGGAGGVARSSGIASIAVRCATPRGSSGSAASAAVFSSRAPVLSPAAMSACALS